MNAIAELKSRSRGSTKYCGTKQLIGKNDKSKAAQDKITAAIAKLNNALIVAESEAHSALSQQYLIFTQT
jgi:hypothetical protein